MADESSIGDLDSDIPPWSLHCGHCFTCACQCCFVQVEYYTLPSIKPKSPRTTSDNVTKEKFASLSANLKAEAHVVDSSIGAEHQHIDALEESIDKRIKAIEEALRNGRTSLADLERAMEELDKRMADGVKLQNENITFEKENNGSRFEMELMRQERSQREALDDLKKNVNTVLLQLLNQTGIGERVYMHHTIGS